MKNRNEILANRLQCNASILVSIWHKFHLTRFILKVPIRGSRQKTYYTKIIIIINKSTLLGVYYWNRLKLLYVEEFIILFATSAYMQKTFPWIIMVRKPPDQLSPYANNVNARVFAFTNCSILDSTSNAFAVS